MKINFRITLCYSFLMVIHGKSSEKVCIPKMGCIQGLTMAGYQSDYFEAFLGIPYAQPPLNELRFANPRPANRWEGILNATIAKPECIQKNYFLEVPIVSGNEDCLYLNVYRPMNLPNNDTLPVMVYIHGGGFFSGSADPIFHGPEYFMDTREVILVVMAYRLGALGFLSTSDDQISGNFALKDQNLALKWIQKNIHAFGGNPKSITLFGHSAGAVSTHLHILTEASKGLFHRAIVLSGTALAPFASPIKNPLNQTRELARLSGIENTENLTSKQLAEALRQIDATILTNAGDGLKYWHVDPLTMYRPVIEANIPNAFLTEDPADIIINGNYHAVPWMTGMVPNEGGVRTVSILASPKLSKEFNEDFDNLMYKLLEFPNDTDAKFKIDSIIDFYLNGVHELKNATAQGFIDIITDRAFYHPFYKTIQSYLETKNVKEAPVYLYQFSYQGPYSFSAIYANNMNDYGVVHSDDLLYLFRAPAIFPDFDKDSADACLIKEHVKSFVQFAKTGQPADKAPICNKKLFYSKPNGICDYQEFKNCKTDGYLIEWSHIYDLERIKLWDTILCY